jgi:hypothetical protein
VPKILKTTARARESTTRAADRRGAHRCVARGAGAKKKPPRRIQRAAGEIRKERGRARKKRRSTAFERVQQSVKRTRSNEILPIDALLFYTSIRRSAR